MKEYLSEIDERFPIRNSTAQKAAFRAWAQAEAEGSVPAGQEDNEGHANLVFGEPAAARVIFTAHYDTPRRSLLPNLMFINNPVLRWIYQFAVIALILLPSVGAALGLLVLGGLDWNALSDRLLVLAVYLAVYIGLFLLFFRGPANKRNRNDNTSGTAAVLSLIRTLGKRSGAAFLLFDDEEKGKKGSSAFAKAHPEIRKNTLIVNLDCVGNGELYAFCPSVGAERNPLYAELKRTMEQSGLPVRFFRPGRGRLNSDQRSFDCGVGVCACSSRPLIGCFTGRIHTARDTVASPETTGRLAEALAAFAERI